MKNCVAEQVLRHAFIFRVWYNYAERQAAATAGLPFRAVGKKVRNVGEKIPRSWKKIPRYWKKDPRC
ncbi:MAG: hypothetical protein JW849_04530 [Phycisphaerae bacterium]|nr:hypothetical protein [Phycisphaerae bacterium]